MMSILDTILQRKHEFISQMGQKPNTVRLGRFEIAHLKKVCLIETDSPESTIAGLRVVPVDADICITVGHDLEPF